MFWLKVTTRPSDLCICEKHTVRTTILWVNYAKQVLWGNIPGKFECFHTSNMLAALFTHEHWRWEFGIQTTTIQTIQEWTKNYFYLFVGIVTASLVDTWVCYWLTAYRHGPRLEKKKHQTIHQLHHKELTVFSPSEHNLVLDQHPTTLGFAAHRYNGCQDHLMASASSNGTMAARQRSNSCERLAVKNI